MNRDLTLKQRKFIDYYIEFGNATEAAIKAGYSKKTAKQIGNENLTKLDCEIKAKIQAKDNERIASQDEVLRFLTSAIRQELQEDVVVVESIGDYQSEARIIKKGTSIKDALAAANSLAKRFGIDKPEQTAGSPQGIIPELLEALKHARQDVE